jgi:hypothetical protein
VGVSVDLLNLFEQFRLESTKALGLHEPVFGGTGRPALRVLWGHNEAPASITWGEKPSPTNKQRFYNRPEGD